MAFALPLCKSANPGFDGDLNAGPGGGAAVLSLAGRAG